ncbi:DUF1349 domain-containing protein [Pseudarcicella hirudinis]|uniref:DUF1349 domain-containing protein n=1 Tax=Pseudarcicella hirudinis TaxID=1079859 RepID=UPI0035EF491C
MKQFFFSALFLLSLSFLSVSGNNSKSVTIKEKADSVKIKAIPNALSWINAPKSFKVTKDNAITITAQKGTDIYHSAAGDFNIATAPLLLFKPADNFVFTASVNVDFRNEYDGGSLMIYRNNKYYGNYYSKKIISGNSRFAQVSPISSQMITITSR